MKQIQAYLGERRKVIAADFMFELYGSIAINDGSYGTKWFFAGTHATPSLFEETFNEKTKEFLLSFGTSMVITKEENVNPATKLLKDFLLEVSDDVAENCYSSMFSIEYSEGKTDCIIIKIKKGLGAKRIASKGNLYVKVAVDLIGRPVIVMHR